MRQDLDLQEYVSSELDYELGLNPVHLGVAACNGTVTLSGWVATFAEKCAAAHAAERVSGVMDVIDATEVRLCADHQRTDSEIMRTVDDLFSLLPYAGVTAVVGDALVTLQGQVEWQFQRHSAENAVAKLTGVRGVSNQITLSPQEQRRAPHGAQAAGIIGSIVRAFERRPALDGRQVTVAVLGGQVTLGGSVSSWNERQQAVRAAWSALGVVQVDDLTEIRAAEPVLSP